ncbi:sulfotransferase [Novosphingobium sp. CF614]|uniref:sulfotransferase n=1 Tax=Novosphingobium sp. CF614 TaxID=1884364 RepID=UPI001160B52D|nr:sulfotransferase [Novosphingobium sp. CF614]
MTLLEEVYGKALKPCGDSFLVGGLLARAEVVTRLGDWGGEKWGESCFRARLDALCRGLEAEAKLHETGRSRAHSRLHVLLCSRLLQVDYHGRMETAPALVAPLVGTGLPRAGTTFLHGLLANDPANRVATAAQAAIPIPLSGKGNFNEMERTALYDLLSREARGEPVPTARRLIRVDPRSCSLRQS